MVANVNVSICTVKPWSWCDGCQCKCFYMYSNTLKLMWWLTM